MCHQNGLERCDSEGVLCIPQSSSITGASPSDILFYFYLPLCRDAVSIFYSPSQQGYPKAKLTLVEGDSKAPFSIATTPRCRGACYSIPWIAPLYP